MLKSALPSDKDSTTILIRIMVGVVFLSEGIQKFIFPELGIERFMAIGFRFPGFLAHFVGFIEIFFGICIVLGLLTRLAVLPLLLIMIFAFETTKFYIINETGLWHFMHEDRTDFAMQIGLLFLLLKGSGNWSFDNLILQYLNKNNTFIQQHN
ncbi:MAG TPA: DoxX family protein [Chitinophagales bacterium]|nr:DoxX family protein [Chitinophagales bacterium]